MMSSQTASRVQRLLLGALLLIALIWIAGPVVSHAIGSAALRIGIPMKNAVRDDLGSMNKK